MKNFLSLKDCMVLFCSPDTCNTLQSLRPSSYPALIFPRPIESFLMSRLLSDAEWAQQENLDKGYVIGHNALLYKLWNEKTNMMKIVADFNPFSSSYFVWLDIGAVRHSRFTDQLMVQRRPAEPGVLLLSVAQFTQAELELGIKKDFTGVTHLGGGTIGSGLASLAAWHTAYYAMVERYRATGRFLGNDQNVMASTCLHSKLCLIVQSEHWLLPFWLLPNHHWFQLQDWFRGEINTNYTKILS